jgi:endonuclease/exonuclease/phosphatase family metal-dependent hydrolase
MRTLIAVVLVVVSLSGTCQSLRVMTYNIRFDNPADGVNQWDQRKEKVFALIKKYDPDVLGVQEALAHQLSDISNQAGSYSYIGVGRDDGKNSGEFSAVLFKKERFDVVEQNTFWLSESPDVPGSKSWDAAITRIATYATMKDKQTGRQFVVLNTHFDHVGKEARKESARIIKEKASELASEMPMIITGDLNCTRDEEPFQLLTNSEVIELIDPASNPEGTFCTFEVNTVPCRPIDYILITNEWRADQYRVIHDNDGKYYPSDHLPVMITLSFSD